MSWKKIDRLKGKGRGRIQSINRLRKMKNYRELEGKNELHVK